jgi:LysR family transcriptional activator for leuABCD operon
MDLNLLKVFMSVMRMKSVSKAADMMNMTAPAVSQALNRLRDHYQDRLFVRQGRAMEPTIFAESLYESIEDAYGLIEKNTADEQHFDCLYSSRKFRIACHQDMSNIVVPELYRYLAKHAPNIQVVFDASHSNDDERQEELRLRKVDFILSNSALNEYSYENLILRDEPLVVAYSANHPRVDDTINYAMFFSEQHIVWRPQSFNFATLDSLSSQPIPKRQIVLSSESVYSSLILCANTEWLSPVTLIHVDKMMANNSNLKVAPLPFKARPLPFYLTWHKERNLDRGCIWLQELLIQLYASISYQHTDCQKIACSLSQSSLS